MSADTSRHAHRIGPTVTPLFVLLLLCLALYVVSKARKRDRPKRDRNIHNGDDQLIAKLRRLAEECTDGSVKVYETSDMQHRAETMGHAIHGSQPVHLDIVWTEEFNPPETYQIEYADRFGEYSERSIHLSRKGHLNGHDYVGIYEDGKFKTLRADRILKAVPVSKVAGARPSLRVLPSYSKILPAWPTSDALFKIKQTAGTRHWTVNLNTYSCTCPEKRLRLDSPEGSLGRVCPHMAEAILQNISIDAGWDPDIIAFLSDCHKVSMSGYIGY